jgi:hypothetical protein
MSELPKLPKRIAAPSHHLSESEQVLTVTGTPRTQSSNTTIQGTSLPNSYLIGPVDPEAEWESGSGLKKAKISSNGEKERNFLF